MERKHIAMLVGGALVVGGLGVATGWMIRGTPTATETSARARAPTEAELAEDELKYGHSRLRYSLTDAALPCFTGPAAVDSPQKVRLAYTLVIKQEVMTVTAIAVVESDLADAAMSACIVAAVGAAKVPSPGVADIEQKQSQAVSLHDLYGRAHSVPATSTGH